MNARRMAVIAVALSVGSLTMEESALAQEESGAQSQGVQCYAVRGEARDTWPGAGNVSTGVITKSGILKGTTRFVYDTDVFTTPDPDTVTFGADFTLTTARGIAKARVLTLFNVATGIWTSIATIDPDTSTGRFAGAMGTLWFPAGTSINLPGGAQAYPSDMTGRLCLVSH